MRFVLPLLLGLAGCGAPSDADYHHKSSSLDFVPACSSCSWAHEVCGEQARAETLADIRESRCGLLVCFAWHHERTTACDQSYAACSADCS